MPQVTIVMYHYVRELSMTRYPDIKGLKVSQFKKQLDYLNRFYNFVTVQECIEAIYGSSQSFPDNAVLLTFDDGYAEHFTEVFPLLNKRNIQGAFFPPAEAILEHKVLDVNKIHFVLASVNNTDELFDEVNGQITKLAEKYRLKRPEYYFDKIGDNEHPYDPKKIVYIKRLLQRELPVEPRQYIIDHLFAKYVHIDEAVFARELYMSTDQIKCMHRSGMFFGGHGYSHNWLNAISIEKQKNEIQRTQQFLNLLGVPQEYRVMCYPYGAYDQTVIDILRSDHWKLGLTTKTDIACLEKDNAFTLARIDTNDVQEALERKITLPN